MTFGIARILSPNQHQHTSQPTNNRHTCCQRVIQKPRTLMSRKINDDVASVTGCRAMPPYVTNVPPSYTQQRCLATAHIHTHVVAMVTARLRARSVALTPPTEFNARRGCPISAIILNKHTSNVKNAKVVCVEYKQNVLFGFRRGHSAVRYHRFCSLCLQSIYQLQHHETK